VNNDPWLTDARRRAMRDFGPPRKRWAFADTIYTAQLLVGWAFAIALAGYYAWRVIEWLSN
jgi:hypothetical protein